MKKRNALIIFLIFIFTFFIIFILYITKPKPQKIKPQKAVVSVKVEKIKRRDFNDIYKTGCEVEPILKGSVRSQVAGEIVFISPEFEVGGNVKKGEKLLEIDKSKYLYKFKSTKNKLEQLKNTLQELKVELKKNKVLMEIAKKNFEISKHELKRNKFLLDKGVISKSQYDNLILKLKTYESNFKNLKLNEKSLKFKIEGTRSQVEATYEELKIARKDLDNCDVRAPFSGTISSKNVNLGDVVNINSPLFSIISYKMVKVKFFVPLYIKKEIAKGEKVKILSTETGENFEGKIKFISQEADEKNRMFQVICVVKNIGKAEKLFPGTFLEAEVPLKTYKDIILLPIEAVRDGGVFVVEKNTARFRRIEVGKIFRKYLEVKGGVIPGDLLIVDGIDLVKDGSLVNIEGEIK